MTADVIGPSVVGEPVVYVTGFIVLVLVTFTGTWAGSLVTVAHEGGHMVMAVLTGRGPFGFQINETKGGGGTDVSPGWGAGMILSLVAGISHRRSSGWPARTWCSPDSHGRCYGRR